MEEKTTNKVNLQKWLEKGNKIPNCVNHGCTNMVSINIFIQFFHQIHVKCVVPL